MYAAQILRRFNVSVGIGLFLVALDCFFQNGFFPFDLCSQNPLSLVVTSSLREPIGPEWGRPIWFAQRFKSPLVTPPTYGTIKWNHDSGLGVINAIKFVCGIEFLR